MIEKLFKYFEDPSRPFLGPNIKAAKFSGLLLPDNLLKRICYIALHSTLVCFLISQYTNIYFIRSNVLLIAQNLKVNLFTNISLLKLCTFLFRRKSWDAIIEYITAADIEQRKTCNPKKIALIQNFTRYCRKITLIQGTLMFIVWLTVVFQPILMYVSSPTYRGNVKNGTEPYFLVVSAWSPFNMYTWSGYLMAAFCQYTQTMYGSHFIASFDTFAMAVMIFFKGELDLLRIDCSEIFGTLKEPVSDEEAISRIKICQRRHTLLIEHAKIYNSCLSPIMFLYMLVCSVLLCVSAFLIPMEPGSVERFSNIAYLVFSVAQLFFYCWHSNEVLNASSLLMHGPYESLWWKRNIKIRKDIYILTAQFKTLIIFSAGPFIDLTAATFINIMKGAYSYYTLLSQSQK